MTAYSYTGLDRSGRTRRGLTEAESERQARRLVRELGLVPVEVKPSGARAASSFGFLHRPRRLGAANLALFTQTLATLLQAGLPIDDALSAIINQTSDERLKPIIMDVMTRVREGHSLESALGDFPMAFNEVYRATVGAGEQTRFLPVVLQRLADHVQRTADLSQRVRLALVYPAILIAISFAVAAVLLVYVVPDVVSVFDQYSGTLPRATTILIAFSTFCRTWGLHALVLVLVLAWGAGRALRRPAVRRRVHRAALTTPILREFVTHNDYGRYAQTLGVLLENGVDMIDALTIAGKAAGNVILGDEMSEVLRRVRQGESLNAALRAQTHPPRILSHLAASGESAGELPRMLYAAATALERTTNARLTVMLHLLEPALILLMGGLILFIVLAILLPIMQMNTMF